MTVAGAGHPDGAEADWARSGVVALTGHPDGPPLVPPGRGASLAVDLAGRLRAATGGRIDLDGAALLGERAAFTGHRRSGRVSPGGHTRLLPTADGWAALSCSRPDDPLLYGALVGAELPADPWPGIARWVAARSGAALAERAELLGLAAGPVASAEPARFPSGALRAAAGLRVVSFGALWAAPLCAHLLRTGGAEVITVETPGRPDGARHGSPDFHRLLHGGERSVVLDPVRDRAALHALVRSADVVIEASRPRALRGFGVDAAAETARGAAWVSVTAAGRDSNRIGFGDDVAAGAGLVAHDADGLPVFCGDALADPLSGLTAAVWALAEPGTVREVPMAGVVAATLAGTAGADGPSPACRRTGDGWVTPAGHPVARPGRREPVGTAPEAGADTAAVLAGPGPAGSGLAGPGPAGSGLAGPGPAGSELTGPELDGPGLDRPGPDGAPCC
ncbi:CoA transferase [Pseudonocardia parietis]|uniref:CoA transferase family III n=1 Tax=Pseudonocardia parietis TaxID=570936 RepID=A0ABS4VVE9_9PSEU|nr:CoA transferase [Pseudonocardia parietis]MBP2367766.1 hypothetical protein [Pseudonocardia parietis]